MTSRTRDGSNGAALPLALDEPIVDQLAAELAMNLQDASDIVRRLAIPAAHAQALFRDAAFGRLVRAKKREWDAHSAAPRRVKLKAMLMLEMNMPRMHAIINDPDTPASAQVQAYNQLKAIAGVEKVDDGERGDKFVLNIILPDGNNNLTLEGTVLEKTVEPQ